MKRLPGLLTAIVFLLLITLNGYSRNGGKLPASATVNFASFTAGEISYSGPLTVCYNDPASTISSRTDASGGDGNITYKWQSSVNGNFTDAVDIANSNSATYRPESLTKTISYRRLAKDGIATSFTASFGTVTFTVRPPFTAGSINASSQEVCYVLSPSQLTNLTLASGGDGNITYKWQRSGNSNFLSPTDIPNSNSASYQPPFNNNFGTQKIVVYYRRLASDGVCNTTFTPSTGFASITNFGHFNTESIGVLTQSICTGGDASFGSPFLTPLEGGSGDYFYKWTANGIDIPNSDTPVYDPPPGLTESTTYKRYENDRGCNLNHISIGSWTVTVAAQPQPGTITKTPNATTVCDGATVSATATAGTGGAGAVSDVLEYSYDGTGNWTAYTAGSSLSTTGHTKVEIRTYRTATGSGCTQSITNTVSWNVAIIPITVTTENSCLGGNNVTFTQTGGAAGGEWSVSGGGTIDPATGDFTPETPGCYTATYSIPGTVCSDTKSFVVFPAAPVIKATANTCDAMFTLPTVPQVSGFYVEYSIDGGNKWLPRPTAAAWKAYPVKARYVLDADCGDNLAGTSIDCTESNLVYIVIFPPILPKPGVSNTCNTPITADGQTQPPAGFILQYSYDGGNTWELTNTSPETPGCYTIMQRYVLNSTYPAGASVTSATQQASCPAVPAYAVIFPAAPVITAPANTIDKMFTLPAVAAKSGFTVQYSIDGGAWALSPTTTARGCHSVKARYVLASACGTDIAGTSAACVESNVVNVVIFPATPNINATPNTCGTMVTLPTVTAVSGFKVEYSIDGGAWATSPSTTVPGCHAIAARYVLAENCGTTLAGSGATIAEKLDIANEVIFPKAPVITAPANTCGTGFTLPAVTPVVGFSVQYRIDGGAWTATPSITTPGCHTVKARYVLANTCATNQAGLSNTCTESNVVNVVIFPAAPVITATANTCGTMFTLPEVSPVPGFSIEYSIDGGAWDASPSTAAPDCHKVKARYVLTEACGGNLAGTSSACTESNEVSVMIFPSDQNKPNVANTCNSPISIQVPVVIPAGKIFEFSFDGGNTWGTYNSSPSTPGCYTVMQRIRLVNTCTNIPPDMQQSLCPAVPAYAVIFPAAPPAPTVNSGYGAIVVTPPASVAGFNIEYSFDDGATWGDNTPPTADNCDGYKIRTRYVLAADCGTNTAGMAGPGDCSMSPATTRIVINTPVSITCPGNQQAVLGGSCQVLLQDYTGIATTGGGCGLVTVTQSPAVSTILSGHNTTQLVTLTATDALGNTATCSFTVTAKDVTPPVITCPKNQIVNLGVNGTVSLGSWGAAKVVENCTIPTITQSPAASIILSGHNAIQLVTLTANDGNGNTSTCSFTVIAKDVTPPSITCPADQTLNLNQNCQGVLPDYTTMATASDNTGVIKITQSPDVGTAVSGTGSMVITLTAYDIVGNSSSCTFNVVKKDITPPAITCPANVTVAITDAGSSYATGVVLGTPATSDACSGVTVNNNAPLQFPYGTTTVQWTATDASGNTSTCNQTVTVQNIKTTTTLTVSPVTQQYSDLVTCVATVKPYNFGNAGFIGGSVTFKIVTPQGTVVLGTVPVAQDGTATLTDTLLENQFYPGATNLTPTNGPLKPGSKTVIAEYNNINTNYKVSNPSAPLDVTCEDADITYNGSTYFTVNPSTLKGTVFLSASGIDKADGTRGDIRNATAKFRDGGPAGTVRGEAGEIPFGLIDPNNKQNGIATTQFTDQLSSGEASGGGKTYNIWVGGSNYYCGGDAANERTILTLAMPGQDFVTGGGYTMFSSNNPSTGTYAGTIGKKMNFGLTMKWNSSGKNLQGQVNIIYRRAVNGVTRMYQIKSNAIGSLAVENVNDAGVVQSSLSATTFRRATINTKANLTDITDPANPVSLGGNLALLVTAWESTTVKTGALDRISVQLTGSGSTGVLFANSWAGTSAQWQTLSGGKMQVRSTSATTTTPVVAAQRTKAAIAEPTTMNAVIYPNPSAGRFSLQVQGVATVPVSVTVTDISGKMIKQMRVGVSQTIHFGEDLKKGIYIVNIIQGENSKLFKIVKL